VCPTGKSTVERQKTKINDEKGGGADGAIAAHKTRSEAPLAKVHNRDRALREKPRTTIASRSAFDVGDPQNSQ